MNTLPNYTSVLQLGIARLPSTCYPAGPGPPGFSQDNLCVRYGLRVDVDVVDDVGEVLWLRRSGSR